VARLFVDVTFASPPQNTTEMASNIATAPTITSWWFRRVLGPDLVKCSSISAEDNDINKEMSVTTIESAILSSVTKVKESDSTSNKDNDTVCEVIGLYFTPVNLCVDEGNVEEFTSKLVDLYDRVNYCCDSMRAGTECCTNNISEGTVTKSAVDQQKSEDNCNSKHRVKTRKLEVIHIVLPTGGNVSGVGTNFVLEAGSDGSCVLDEGGFRKVVKDLPWFAIPYRDIQRTVCTLL
jgi:hypothetical protein